MKQISLKRTPLIGVIVLAASLLSSAQTGGKNYVDEKNVRAEMNFLAGDAMQGRGSGTLFERIAAEYIGSQFMQFELEPAGEMGPDGKPTFVQTVTILRGSFSGKPTLKYGTTTLEHGGEMVLMRATAAAASGDLQRIILGDSARAGAAAFVKLRDGDNQQKLMQALLGPVLGGASIIIVEETVRHHIFFLTGHSGA